MALMILVDKIATALDEGNSAIGIFLDFSKAFDIVDHNILFKRIECYSVRGLSLSWFKSYLTNRKQFVNYDGIESSAKYITCGVPQGSILGPLLFLLYINNIASVSIVVFSTLFADDTNIFLTGSNIPDMIKTMNAE
jgi:hypothetical protein